MKEGAADIDSNVSWHVEKTAYSLTSPPPEFDLISLEISLVLHHFDEPLQEKKRHRNVTGVRRNSSRIKGPLTTFVTTTRCHVLIFRYCFSWIPLIRST